MLVTHTAPAFNSHPQLSSANGRMVYLHPVLIVKHPQNMRAHRHIPHYFLKTVKTSNKLCLSLHAQTEDMSKNRLMHVALMFVEIF